MKSRAEVTYKDPQICEESVREKKISDFSKCQFVIRLKNIKCYERFLCYLSFLSHISGLLLIFVTALFVAILLGL